MKKSVDPKTLRALVLTLISMPFMFFMLNAQVVPEITLVNDVKTVHPLDMLTVVCNSKGNLSVKDGEGREYLHCKQVLK